MPPTSILSKESIDAVEVIWKNQADSVAPSKDDSLVYSTSWFMPDGVSNVDRMAGTLRTYEWDDGRYVHIGVICQDGSPDGVISLVYKPHEDLSVYHHGVSRGAAQYIIAASHIKESEEPSVFDDYEITQCLLGRVRDDTRKRGPDLEVLVPNLEQRFKSLEVKASPDDSSASPSTGQNQDRDAEAA
jgi:hypothetical protein